MTTLIFSNADYYKNEKFQELMREWNNIDYFKDDPKIYEQVYQAYEELELLSETK